MYRATGALDEKVFDKVPFLGDVTKIVDKYNLEMLCDITQECLIQINI